MENQVHVYNDKYKLPGALLRKNPLLRKMSFSIKIYDFRKIQMRNPMLLMLTPHELYLF